MKRLIVFLALSLFAISSQAERINLTSPAGNGCCEVAGDANHSGSLTIGDVTFLIARIFSGGPAPMCADEGDANGNGSLTIGDVTHLIARIFSGGPSPICGNSTLALHSGTVAPGNGIPTDTYSYQVVFIDTLNNPPLQAEVFVNGLAQSMNLDTGSLLIGAAYEYQSTAPLGQNSFYYRFITSSDDTLFYPPVGYDIGPAVTSDTTIIIAEEAVAIDSLPGLIINSIEGAQFSFDLVGSPPALSVGDIIVGEDTSGTSGYLKKVTFAYVENGQLVIETVEAAMDELIISGGLADTIMVFEQAAFNRQAPSLFQQSTEVTMAQGVEYSSGTWNFSGLELYSGSAGSANLTATVTSGSVSFNPVFDFDINWKPFFSGLKNFRGVADGSFNATATVSLDASGPLSYSASKTIAEIKKKFKFLVGYIPVWLETTAKIKAGFDTDLDAALSVSSGASQSTTLTVGAIYDGSNWSSVWAPNVGPIAPLPVTWSGSANASAGLYIKPEIELRLYSVLGIGIEAGPEAQLEGTFESTEVGSCWEWSLIAGMNGKIDLNANVLGKELFNQSFDVFSTESEIASESSISSCSSQMLVLYVGAVGSGSDHLMEGATFDTTIVSGTLNSYDATVSWTIDQSAHTLVLEGSYPRAYPDYEPYVGSIWFEFKAPVRGNLEITWDLPDTVGNPPVRSIDIGYSRGDWSGTYYSGSFHSTDFYGTAEVTVGNYREGLTVTCSFSPISTK